MLEPVFRRPPARSTGPSSIFTPARSSIVFSSTADPLHTKQKSPHEPNRLRLQDARKLRQRTVPDRSTATRVDVDRHRHLRHAVVDAIYVERQHRRERARSPDGIGRRLQVLEVVGHHLDVGRRGRDERERIAAAVRIRIRRICDDGRRLSVVGHLRRRDLQVHRVVVDAVVGTDDGLRVVAHVPRKPDARTKVILVAALVEVDERCQAGRGARRWEQCDVVFRILRVERQSLIERVELVVVAEANVQSNAGRRLPLVFRIEIRQDVRRIGRQLDQIARRELTH